MFLTKYNPMSELGKLESRFIDAFPVMKFEGDLLGFTPVAKTREGERAYHIEADLPGVENIQAKAEKGVLEVTIPKLVTEVERSKKIKVK
jgi:HSP20 family protein